MDNIDTDFLSYLCAGDESKIQDAVKKSGEKSFIFEERLSSANKLVDEGNARFKDNDHSSAHQLYLQAAYHIDFDLGQQFDMTEEHKKQIRVSILQKQEPSFCTVEEEQICKTTIPSMHLKI